MRGLQRSQHGGDEGDPANAPGLLLAALTQQLCPQPLQTVPKADQEEIKRLTGMAGIVPKDAIKRIEKLPA